MRNVGQIRQYVWDFLDLEEEDLQAPLIDVWIMEAWRRIVRRTRRWPYFETEWSLDVQAINGHEVSTANLVPPLDEIDTIENTWGNLTYLDEGQARDTYNVYNGVPTTGRPEAFTLQAEQLRIYPKPDTDYTMRMLGWRQPDATWMAAGTGAVPDFPDELEDALLCWVMHRAYTQQDDLENATSELQRYTSAVDEMVSHLIQGPLAQPMVLGGSGRRRNGPFGERPVPWGAG